MPNYADIDSMGLEGYLAIKAEIDSQSDRGAAVIACSLLEEHLKWAIDRCFVELTADTSKRIFEGPLGPLFNRSYLGFALGLYDRNAREEIILIGTIRNRFAHKIAPINFSDDEVDQLCGRLFYPKLHKSELGDGASNREKYLHSCWILRALVTAEFKGIDRLKSPDHSRWLEALAESVVSSLPHDRSDAQRRPLTQTADQKQARE